MRLWSTILTAAALLFAATPASAAPGEVPRSWCGFADAPGDIQRFSHQVSYRKGVTCSQAKAILRRLRGDATLIPMACMSDRWIDGWHLRNLDRDSAPLQWTQFRRGGLVINYRRWENFEAASCVPPGGFVFNGE